MKNKLFLKHSALAFFIRILGASSGILMNLFIANNLSVEQSGLFFLSFAIFSAVSMLCTIGLTDAFVRFIGGYHSDNNWAVIKGVFQTGLKKVACVSILVSLCLYLLAELLSISVFSKPNLSPILQMLAIGIPFFALYQLISFAFQGLHKPLPSVLFQNILNPILVVLVLLLFTSLGIVYTGEIVATIFIFSAFITLCCAFIFWHYQSISNVDADYSQTKALFKSANPLWFMMLMNMAVLYSGQIITGIYVTSEQVAFFSVAQRVAMLTSFVLITVNLVAAPRFAASTKQNKPEELRATSLLCSRVMVIVSIPILIFMLSFPEFLLGFFGEEYKSAALILQILVVGQFINVITGSVGFLLNMTGHERDMRNVVFLSCPIAIVLGFILTPLYGAIGAAIATSVALSSQNLLAVYMVKKRLGFNTLNLFKQ